MPSRIVEWIDHRFPLTSFVKHDLTDYPTRAISVIGEFRIFGRHRAGAASGYRHISGDALQG